MSSKKSACNLKELLWALSGLSNIFCDYILLLGLDLFLSYCNPECFPEREFLILKYCYFGKQEQNANNTEGVGPM